MDLPPKAARAATPIKIVDAPINQSRGRTGQRGRSYQRATDQVGTPSTDGRCTDPYA
jgi:hypothetical protein